MTFQDVLNKAYVGKIIKSIEQPNAPTFHKSARELFQGKKIIKVWINCLDVEYQKLYIEVSGVDFPLGLFFHETIELE
jgi:hypothetical protein